MASISDFGQNFPEELTHKIFSNLDTRDLARCSQVCKDWHRIASDDTFWKPIFQQLNIPLEEGAKSYVDKRVVTSKEGLLEHVRQFSNKISYNQFGSLTCTFPFSPEQEIKIYLGYGDNVMNEQSVPDLEEKIFVMDRFPENPRIINNHIAQGHCSREVFLAGKIVHSVIKDQPLIYMRVETRTTEDPLADIQPILERRIDVINKTVEKRNNIVAGLISAPIIATIGATALGIIAATI